jgi:hypothetical protein
MNVLEDHPASIFRVNWLVALSSKTLVSYHKTVWCHSPEDLDMNTQSGTINSQLTNEIWIASFYCDIVFNGEQLIDWKYWYDSANR